jgi:MFS family permease
MKKIDLSIIMGNVLDKFDTSLYSFLAPLLAPIFFPNYDPAVQLILTYATSITSIFARPCGTFLFGTCARYYGPVYALSYSLMGVAITTIIIGLIPGYGHVGWFAPFSLVIMRLLRGICAAGESTVAKLYIMEDKTDGDALRASYIYQTSSMMGIIMASGISTIIISIYPHAWRYCFFLGGFTAVVAWHMRISCVSTASHTTVYQGYTYGNIWLLWKEKKNVVRVALVTIFSHMTYAVPFVFMNNFVPLVTTISLSTMMYYNTSLLIFDMIAVPFIGYCTQRYNAMHVMLSASIVLSCTIIPLFYFLSQASLWYILFVRVWIVLWGVIFLCPVNFWCKKLFEPSQTYFLVGMGNALGTATLGHMTTPICLWLWYVTGLVYAPALYIMCVMVLTVCAICK